MRPTICALLTGVQTCALPIPAAWHAARKVYLPHYLRYLTSQARYGDETHCDKSADSDSRRILTLMFQAGQQSGEVDTRQAAAQIEDGSASGRERVCE